MNTTIIRDRVAGEPSISKLMRSLKTRGIETKKTGYYDETFRNTNLLIRWGHYGDFILAPGSAEINSAESIQLGSNKKKTRKALQDNYVSVPKTFFSKQEALRGQQFNYPLIGRPSHHTQGQDIEFIENRDQLIHSDSSYYSEFLPKQKEFRVYVFDGNILGVIEKIPQNVNEIAWNRCLGATFVDLTPEEFDMDVVNEAIKSAKVIGQYFSAVDLMVYNGKPYILELNSSPAISNDHRLNLWTSAFEWLIKTYDLSNHIPDLYGLAINPYKLHPAVSQLVYGV